MYEYQVRGETERKFSVAHVVRPGTRATNACLCFTLMSKMPDGKPWLRAADHRDPSRGVLLDLLDLQEDCDWKMDSTVMIPNVDPITAFDDNMQVQCLPVYGADQPKWTYRKVPKAFHETVGSHRNSLIIGVTKTNCACSSRGSSSWCTSPVISKGQTLRVPGQERVSETYPVLLVS